MVESAPKVLIESDDAAIAWAARSVLERHGYEVTTCAGPQAFGPSGCPIVATGHCDLVDDADLVVHALHGSDPENREILRELVEHPADTPVVAEASARPGRAEAPLPEGVAPMAAPMTRARLLATVADSVGLPATMADDETSG